MRPPHDDELDDEIRGHLAISIKERIDRGEDPVAARQAALREFGNVTLARESIRGVWRHRWYNQIEGLVRDLRLAVRSLWRAKGLAATVIVTLALGIGANAAIFSVVRGVLLRPLVNRDEDRLLYIRQSAPGIGEDNYLFSMPEIADLTSQARTISAFGDFSTADLALVGLTREPRSVKAAVVNGSYFDVMGLRAIRGRLLTPADDGPKAHGAAVLTYRFWSTELNADPSVIGKVVRLGIGPATIVGVLEPSVPYPTDTEIIANMVTSPHHLGATMTQSRTHRMTDLFARLAPGATLETARAELTAIHGAMMAEHPGDYSKQAAIRLTTSRLRDQITAPARTILLTLLITAALVFVIACSNVANLVLARSVRREGELAVRAALGAGTAALRRTLLAESLVLCGAGALVGIVLSRPFVALVARYAARFSVRALDVSVDSSVLWVGAGLALAAAIVLAVVPRLPSSHAPSGLGLASGSLRITPGTNRRLRAFATAQIALSFVLLAGAGMVVTTLVSLRSANTGLDMAHVLAFDVPMAALASRDRTQATFYEDAPGRIERLPGVVAAAVGTFVPWRDAGDSGPSIHLPFTAEGYALAGGEEPPLARFRIVSPHFFSTLGVPLLAGRDFTDADRADKDAVAIVSHTLAQRYFPNGDAVNRHLTLKPFRGSRRIVGVVADVDDESLDGKSVLTIYQPLQQIGISGRLFVRTAGDPTSLVPEVTRVIRELSAEQPVARAATLEEIRSEVLSPERVNAFVFSGFAGIALLIAVVGIAGVLAFSVSARIREFGVRLAVGSSPRRLLVGVLSDGARMAIIGTVIGLAGGFVLALVAGRLFPSTQVPGIATAGAAAVVLMGAAALASLLPAARAARVDVLKALRSE